MDFQTQIDLYLRARFTLIAIISPEEERITQAVRALCERTQRNCIAWDVADGFNSLVSANGSLPNAKDPLTALEYIQRNEGQAGVVFLLKDFHEVWGNTQVKRKLRNTSQQLKYTKKNIIITMPSVDIPNELRDDLVIVDYPLPDSVTLEGVLDNLIQAPGIKNKLTPLGKEKFVQAALGLTASQAQRVFAKAIVRDGLLDERSIDLVTEEKKQIIRESEALEFYSVFETPDHVGGLGILKDWLKLRENAFSIEAQRYGLPSPKGIALLGIPGTGKSLTAKMIGGLWHIPLLKLDVGSLFGSLVGESEERTRRALKMAETVAPCILWIDEMEKALTHGGQDSGTSTRVFGTILTWMQEKTLPVFVVATANDISSMPPELLRKGRFDEIFFLDLPTEDERKEILEVHLKKRNRIPGAFDIPRLAAASSGYVGAEIEQAIIDAMYIGFNENQREIVSDDIALCLKKLVPLSVSQREKIEGLRDWLREGRAQSASFNKPEEAVDRFVQIHLEIQPRF